MPKRKEHLAVGIIAGLGVGLATAVLVEKRDRWLHVVTCTLSAGVGARLPDVMEPALSPNHRGVAHSVAAGVGVGVLMRARHHARCLELALECDRRAAALQRDSPQWGAEVRGARLWRLAAAALLGLLAGYASHLVMDGATPRSLPLII